MIALETKGGGAHIENWPAKLAEPMPLAAIRWRQVGKPTQRDGKTIANVVAYVDAEAVRDRLDAIVPGEWDLTLEVLPDLTDADNNGVAKGRIFAVKSKLIVLGVIRENIGQGKDWKSAATDAFKRVGHSFGIGRELASSLYKNVWVEVEDRGKYVKLIGDPAKVVADRRARLERSGSSGANGGGAQAPARQPAASGARSSAPASPAPPLKDGPTPAAARPNPREQHYAHKSELPF